ncbi:MAG: radical SAM protein [Oligoflexia bacterium]|nr:radical SAM protein [Oligoflexia bacterium]
MDLHRLIWALTNKCNLSCDFCYAMSSPNAEEGVSTEVALKFVDEINNSPTKHVSLVGGEPLLREDIEIIVRRFRPDITISIGTNGILIDKKWSDYLTKRILQVSIGLDGSPSINSMFRAQTERVASNIRSLIKDGVRVAIPMLVNAKNYNTIDAAVKYVASLGVSKIKINKFIPVYGSQNAQDLSLSRHQEITAISLMRKAIDENSELEKLLSYSGWYSPEYFKKLTKGRNKRSSCYCGVWSMAIAFDGSVVPCNVLTQRRVLDFFNSMNKYKILNIADGDIFNKISTNDLFIEVIRAAVALIPPGCSNCDRVDKCTHGCRIYAFLKTNNWEGHVPYCNYLLENNSI